MSTDRVLLCARQHTHHHIRAIGVAVAVLWRSSDIRNNGCAEGLTTRHTKSSGDCSVLGCGNPAIAMMAHAAAIDGCRTQTQQRQLTRQSVGWAAFLSSRNRALKGRRDGRRRYVSLRWLPQLFECNASLFFAQQPQQSQGHLQVKNLGHPYP